MEVHTSHLVVSPVPHVRASLTTRRVMANVILALLPALIASVVIFGLRALLVTAVTVAAYVAMEWAWCVLRHEKQTVGDLSAVVTGLLLAFNLPSTVPLYLPIIGAAAILVTKQLLHRPQLRQSRHRGAYCAGGAASGIPMRRMTRMPCWA